MLDSDVLQGDPARVDGGLADGVEHLEPLLDDAERGVPPVERVEVRGQREEELRADGGGAARGGEGALALVPEELRPAAAGHVDRLRGPGEDPGVVSVLLKSVFSWCWMWRG